MTTAPLEALTQFRARAATMPADLSEGERSALRRIADLAHIHLPTKDRAALDRLIEPLEAAVTVWAAPGTSAVARNLVLTEAHRQQRAY